jgi:hypothetical protein
VFVDRGKIKHKARKLTTKIWKMKDEIEGGRVGEALDRVGPESRDSGRPDSRKGGTIRITPAFRGPAKAGVCR